MELQSQRPALVRRRSEQRWRVNDRVADRLDEAAELLQQQDANPFRVQAYHRAAQTVRTLEHSVADIAQKDGLDGLEELPGIGHSLARAIHQVATTGRWPMLLRLRGETDATDLLATVPGVGRRTAERLQDELSIATLEDLEQAAHDGRLERVLRVRGKRLAAIRSALEVRLGRAATASPRGESIVLPEVAEVLDVDRQYREEASRGLLKKIAPRRFNPQREAWLPVLHTERGARHYTALFSNTARAHQFGRTADWVVIYFDGRQREHQCTVVTEAQGALAGRRVVRGREAECARHYGAQS